MVAQLVDLSDLMGCKIEPCIGLHAQQGICLKILFLSNK